MAEQNYTLGRGKIFLALRNADGTYQGERYIGNTPAFGLTINRENLEHFGSDEGVREKDRDITLQTNRSGSFTTDNINPENLAALFFGSASVLTQAAAVGQNESFASVEQGLEYQLGMTAGSVAGVRDIENVVVEVATVAMTVDVDYEVDAVLGRIKIIEGGGISDGDDIDVTYDTTLSTREQVITGADQVEARLRFIANNPEGKDIDYVMPWVKLSPNGEVQLKGESWQELPFTVDIQKLVGLPAIAMDGRPFGA